MSNPLSFLSLSASNFFLYRIIAECNDILGVESPHVLTIGRYFIQTIMLRFIAETVVKMTQTMAEVQQLLGKQIKH